MKTTREMKFLLSAFLFAFTTVAFAQSPEGTWITVDDKTGERTGHVEIFMKNGELFGKVTKFIRIPDVEYCVKCKGSDDRKDQHILGMEIMRNFKKDGEKWFGKILDPENGKVYTSTISLDGANVLKLRGYIGVQWLGRTQRWERLKKFD